MSERARRVVPVLVILALVVAWQLPEVSWLRLAGPPDDAARMTATLDGLPDEPRVLVGFDPDVGTYAEIRPTVRAFLADLLARSARVALVSLTPEGRALALVELDRLGRAEANPTQLVDLGFVAGAEAGLVDLTRSLNLPDRDAAGAFLRELQADGIGAFDAVAVVGGNDLGPRSWVEQVGPRIGDVPLLAVTPTILLPEIQPYLAGGQLSAALATPRDGAAYRATLRLGNLDRLLDPTEPRSLPLLVGMLIVVGMLGQALAARLVELLRVARARDSG